MPGGVCGTWPAFWMLGSGQWPTNGEIDIVEGVNDDRTNLMTLHTSDSCVAESPLDASGELLSGNCAVSSSPAGCGVNASGPGTYGQDFNEAGGGVYAVQWTSEFIKMWFFPRNLVPVVLFKETPDVNQLGPPQAHFEGSTCDIDSHFKEHRLIFDTTFCGDWAGNTYAQSGCPQLEGVSSMESCIDYVANHPDAFREA